MISQSWINSDHTSGLIFSSLSIHHKYSSKASAISLAFAHDFNFDFAYFIALRSRGSVSLAFISKFDAFVKKSFISLLLLNFALRNFFSIILHASLAIFVAHWIRISCISFATLFTLFKSVILFLFDTKFNLLYSKILKNAKFLA
jgi:hypothetical protein